MERFGAEFWAFCLKAASSLPSGVAPGLLFLCCAWAHFQGGSMCFVWFLVDPAEGGLTLLALLLFAVSAVRWQQGQAFGASSVSAACALLLGCFRVEFRAALALPLQCVRPPLMGSEQAALSKKHPTSSLTHRSSRARAARNSPWDTQAARQRQQRKK